MENFKNEIRSKLEEIIAICEDNDIECQEVILYDIAFEGAFSFAFHNDIECEDLPDDLEVNADEIEEMFCIKNLFHQDRKDIIDEFIDSLFNLLFFSNLKR